jgi:hypothetical protein
MPANDRTGIRAGDPKNWIMFFCKGDFMPNARKMVK